MRPLKLWFWSSFWYLFFICLCACTKMSQAHWYQQDYQWNWWWLWNLTIYSFLLVGLGVLCNSEWPWVIRTSDFSLLQCNCLKNEIAEPPSWQTELSKEELVQKLNTTTKSADHLNGLLRESEATNAILMEQIKVSNLDAALIYYVCDPKHVLRTIICDSNLTHLEIWWDTKCNCLLFLLNSLKFLKFT